MYALVQNGEVVRIGIAPDFCLDGCTVSNPQLLPPATLASCGYLPYAENIPEYTDAQMPVFDHYEILADGVIGHYSVTAKPPTMEEELESLKSSFELLDGAFFDALINGFYA